MHPVREVHNVSYEAVMPKNLYLNLRKPLEVSPSLQEMRGTENSRTSHESQANKIQIIGNTKGRTGVFSKEIPRKQTVKGN